MDLQLLGGIRVWRGFGDEIAISSKASRALILYLALHPHDRRSREQLATFLWPDRGVEQSRHSLRQTLFSFRQTFEEQRAALLKAEGDEIWLDPSVDVDVWNFLKLAREPTTQSMNAAVALYNGELAAGFHFRSDPFERWLAAERSRLRDAACGLMSRLVAQFTSLGDLDEAIRINRKLIEADPVREESHRSLMRLLAAAGQHQAVLDQYRDCANALRRLLDAAPGPETTKLLAEIRAPVAEPAVGPAPGLSIESADAGRCELPPAIGRTIEPMSKRSESAESAPPALAPAPRSTWRIPHRASVVAAAIALLLGVAGWYTLNLDRAKHDTIASAPPHTAKPTSTASTLPDPARTPPLSLVVLPFVNLSDDKQQDWFVDGITEELTTDLSRVPNALVIARSSAFTYKGKFVDVKQIGRELNVRYVIEGSVRPDGDEVRLLLQIAEAQRGSQLWSDRFTFRRAEVAKTLDLVVAGAARAIQLKLEDAEGRRLTRERPSNADAAELMMRARSLMNTISKQRLQALKEAVPLLEKATAIDPNSVSAWAMLASARALQIHIRPLPDTRIDGALFEAARTAAERALAIDPNSVVALLAMGHVRRATDKPDEAIPLYERARTLNPYYWPIIQELGRAYTLADRPEEAIAIFDLAVRISPRDPGLGLTLSSRCSANLMLRRYDDAVADCEASMKYDIGLSAALARMATAYASVGNYQRGSEVLGEFRRRHPDVTVRSCKNLSHPSYHPGYREYVNRSCNMLGTVGLPE